MEISNMNLIQLIQDDLPLTTNEIRVLLLTAPRRYKVHEIEKRNGRGKRLIAQPTAEIKTLQRWAIDKFTDFLPIHEAATAYKKGSSIKKHASMHANSKYLLKLDFKDFFPSINVVDFIKHANLYLKLSGEDTKYLANLLFRLDRNTGKLILSIGAPSSPLISNSIMYQFDTEVFNFCSKQAINYSRYADDLALSTDKPKALDEAYKFIDNLCKTIRYPKLALNDEKTVFTSQKYHRQLTGLVLANGGVVSLGRNKKRLIRAIAHKFSKGLLEEAEVHRLRGLLAYAYSIEPEFVGTISKMMGADLLDTLKRY
jgi:RNA-directed DNA polymerase